MRQMGFQVISRNRSIAGVEIDIIARSKKDGDFQYYFIEVKQVKRENYFRGFPPVTLSQMERYNKARVALFQENQKIINIHLSLLILDEDLQKLEFIDNFDLFFAA